MPSWATLFRVAAIFNWLAGLPLLTIPATMLASLGAEPPDDLTFVRMSGLLVAFFGAVYWIIARDAQRYGPIAKLAVAGKFSVFVLFAQGWLAGQVPDGAAGLAVVDLAFGIAFAWALVTSKNQAN